MKTSPLAKITILLALYFAAHLLDACQICDCPNVKFPFFDYKKIALTTNNPIAMGFFTIAITPDSVDLVAQASPLRFQVCSSAYACSCNGDGEQGDKYAPLSMDVFADRDFNDTLPAGASLRSLFKGTTQGDIFTTLSPSFRPDKFEAVTNEIGILSNEKPIYPGEPYRFTIQWVKSNGDTLVAQTDAVIFN
jgi:hypothetical protein